MPLRTTAKGKAAESIKVQQREDLNKPASATAFIKPPAAINPVGMVYYQRGFRSNPYLNKQL